MSIVKDILSGQHDHELDSILQATRERKRISGRIEERSLFIELGVGEEVRFNATTHPTYLVGAIGTIVKKNRTKIVVDLSEPVVSEKGKIWHKGISVPMSFVERNNVAS